MQETQLWSLGQEDPLEVGGHGNPLQRWCLENSMDGGAWQAAVHRVAQSWKWLSSHSSSMKHPLINLYQLFNFPQVPNDHIVIDTELFDNFSCSCKRISFNDCSQLVTAIFPWPVTVLLIFKALVSLPKLLEPPLHCMFVSSSWAKCIVDVVSCLHCFTTHFELE